MSMSRTVGMTITVLMVFVVVTMPDGGRGGHATNIWGPSDRLNARVALHPTERPGKFITPHGPLSERPRPPS
jgi:hypothetical protein